jgi:hypothetical protein
VLSLQILPLRVLTGNVIRASGHGARLDQVWSAFGGRGTSFLTRLHEPGPADQLAGKGDQTISGIARIPRFLVAIGCLISAISLMPKAVWRPDRADGSGRMEISTHRITSYVPLRVLGFEPRTYALKGQVSIHKCLSPLYLHCVFGVKNQVSSYPAMILRWFWTHPTVESDAQTDAQSEARGFLTYGFVLDEAGEASW